MGGYKQNTQAVGLGNQFHPNSTTHFNLWLWEIIFLLCNSVASFLLLSSNNNIVQGSFRPQKIHVHFPWMTDPWYGWSAAGSLRMKVTEVTGIKRNRLEGQGGQALGKALNK